MLVSLYDYDIETSCTSIIATLFNIGPGLNKVGAVENYSHFPAPVKFFQSLCMVIGRLEIFSILVLFVPMLWKK